MRYLSVRYIIENTDIFWSSRYTTYEYDGSYHPSYDINFVNIWDGAILFVRSAGSFLRLFVTVSLLVRKLTGKASIHLLSSSLSSHTPLSLHTCRYVFICVTTRGSGRPSHCRYCCHWNISNESSFSTVSHKCSE